MSIKARHGCCWREPIASASRRVLINLLEHCSITINKAIDPTRDPCLRQCGQISLEMIAFTAFKVPRLFIWSSALDHNSHDSAERW